MLSTRMRSGSVLDEHPSQQFLSAHSRQIQVPQHKVRLFCPKLLERLAAVGRLDDLRLTVSDQQVLQAAADNHVIVDHKIFTRACLPAPPTTPRRAAVSPRRYLCHHLQA